MALDLFGPGVVDQSGNATNAVAQRPAEGRVFGTLDTWFRDCTSTSAQDGTVFASAFFNGLLGDLRTLCRGNGMKADGVSPVLADANADSQILTAIQLLVQRGLVSCGLDTGTANAVVVALNPAPPELVDGMLIAFKAAADNTGPTTLSIGGSTYPMVAAKQAALRGGELAKGDWHTVRVTIVQGVTMMRLSGGSTSGTAQGTPRLLQITYTQNYTPTAGTRRIAVLATGPGGPGGSGKAGANGDSGAGGGGGESILGLFDVSSLTLPILCVIGASSTPTPIASATIGSTAPLGSQTRFGSLVTANPGASGLNNCQVGSGGLGGSGGTGGISFPGSPGEGVTGSGYSQYRGGTGGRSLRSGGGLGADGDMPGQNASAANGGNAPGPGGGGGGGDTSSNTGAFIGGTAGNGEILILEMV